MEHDTTQLRQGVESLYVEGAMKRNTFENKFVNANVDMRAIRHPSMGFPLWVRGGGDAHVSQTFDYTMKALYEYGNNQYQFTADGAPTKVLPNLVPVNPSSGIPQLQ
jgi:hypothetical protein